MTISTTSSSITYLGNGGTTVFSFPFVADNSMTIQVTYVDSNGVSTILNPSVYTLSINAPSVGQIWGIGGSVTYPNTGSPPVAILSGTSLTITRIVPYEQTVTISNQGPFYPQTVETGLDLLELQIQQLVTDFEYAIQAPTTDSVPPNPLPPAAERANGYLGFDNNGQPIVEFGSFPPSPPVGAITRKVSVSGTNTISVLTTDAFGGVSVYQSGTPVTTVQLPTTGGPYPIFDGSLNANQYPIKVLPPAGLLILGLSSYSLVYRGQSCVCYNDGTQVLLA